MVIKQQSTYIWDAVNLENNPASGVVNASSKRKVKKNLLARGYFHSHLTEVPASISSTQMKTGSILDFLHSLIMMLKAGMSLNEALHLMQRDNRSLAKRYVCNQLIESLQKGCSLRESFVNLTPLFPGFFISMIDIAEQSDQLINGFESAYAFYQKKAAREKEMKQVLRYPLIVLSATLALLLAVLIFIVPMFNTVYLMFGDDLPILTQWMVKLSSAFHCIDMGTFVVIGTISILFSTPSFKRFNPLLKGLRQIQNLYESSADTFLYALSMNLQLENGQALINASQQAAACMTKRHQAHGKAVSRSLQEGLSLTEAFKHHAWFPPIFRQVISTSEQSGRLSSGFLQISQFLEQKRSDRFASWSKGVEPAMMCLLGAIVLALLLAIYLPIFDLGNAAV